MKRSKESTADEIDEMANPSTLRRKRRVKKRTRADKALDTLSAAYYRSVLRLEKAARSYAARPGVDLDESRDLCRVAIAFAAAHYAFSRGRARGMK